MANKPKVSSWELAALEQVDKIGLMCAEVAFRCAERGENWEATRARVVELLGENRLYLPKG